MLINALGPVGSPCFELVARVRRAGAVAAPRSQAGRGVPSQGKTPPGTAQRWTHGAFPERPWGLARGQDWCLCWSLVGPDPPELFLLGVLMGGSNLG